MPLAAAVAFLLALGTLAGAAYAPAPAWLGLLYASGVAWSLFVPLLLLALLEWRLPGRAADLRGGTALLLAGLAAAQSWSRPVGKLPERPLVDLLASARSVGALGAALLAVGLAVGVLRHRSRAGQALAALALMALLVVISPFLAGVR